MTKPNEGAELHPVHAWIARVGVLGIAVVAFLFVYDAGVTFAEAVGYRIALGRLWPWLIEGFLALVVYTGSIIRRQGGSVAYPACLFGLLLAVSGYMNVRVHTHHGGPLALKPVESGSASALPVLILAASVHLLIRTFESSAGPSSAPKPDAAMPDTLTVGKIQEVWSAQPEPAPVDTYATVEHEPEAEPEPEPVAVPATPSGGMVALPAQPSPALRGAANFRQLAERAPSPSARAYWLNLANGGVQTTAF